MFDFREEFLADLTAGMWTSIKMLAAVAALVWVGFILWGCSTKTLIINEAGINATSSAFLYCPEASVIQINDGNRTGNMTADESGVGTVLQKVSGDVTNILGVTK